MFDFSKKEEEVLKFWQDNKIFEKSLEKNKDKDLFSFYDGPPFATGLPHYGHILASVIKDVVPRYQTMRGKVVYRRWGWDCHGLPIENLIEQEMGFKTKKDIENFGIENFNKKAKESVLRYADEWKKIIPRIGRWVDMENDYKTMDKTYTESVWWVFKTLYDKGLIYEGYKSMHICPRCETTLSNFEVTQNYQEVKDISVTVKFELEDEPGVYLLAWTTTPWTLPGNVALAVKEDIEYVKMEVKNFTGVDDGIYIFSKKDYKNFKETIDREKKNNKETVAEILDTFEGRKLVGKKYKPLFDYYQSKDLENYERGWRVYAADFVTIEEGTGIVHIAPAFGEEDMELGKRERLPFIQHVTTDGRFKPEVKDFAGLFVKPKGNPKETDQKIVDWLKEKKKLFLSEIVSHSYPLCWRCDTPLLNYASSSWFVKVTEIKERMIEINKTINWIPEHLRLGRFGKWLDSLKDWAISRSRYWGAPLPVWRCESCKNIKVLGSTEELPDPQIDLHRPYIDEVEFTCSCGGKMKRIPEVFDCWFESGSMPYGQFHYPFENKDEFEKSFPAEFIAEGVDQTRGWFYTLLVLSTALFDKTAYKNVITNGIILAENGQKMSKRLKNYPDPIEIIEKYGADSLRFYLLDSPVVRAENLNFSENGVKEIYQKVIMRFFNVCNFLKMYQKDEDDFNHSDYNLSKNILDRWIIALFKKTLKEITDALDTYRLDDATKSIKDFIDDLSNWYLRRSRERFKDKTEDSKMAELVLRNILLKFSKVIAPFIPFLAERIYKDLKGKRESVHLEDWPEIESITVEEEKILERMSSLRKYVELILAKRAEAGIKIRQPLKKVFLPEKFEKEYEDLIKEETNIKEIGVFDNDKKDIEIDTNITEELKEEGNLRELIRNIQELRKEKGLLPQEVVDLIIECKMDEERLIKKYTEEIQKSTNTLIKFAANSGQEVLIDNLLFKIEVKNS